jgi:hypothetical protein
MHNIRGIHKGCYATKNVVQINYAINGGNLRNVGSKKVGTDLSSQKNLTGPAILILGLGDTHKKTRPGGPVRKTRPRPKADASERPEKTKPHRRANAQRRNEADNRQQQPRAEAGSHQAEQHQEPTENQERDGANRKRSRTRERRARKQTWPKPPETTRQGRPKGDKGEHLDNQGPHENPAGPRKNGGNEKRV